MKIDIVVQNYPPERIAVHYTSDLAEAFAKHGWSVRVVTASPHAPTGRSYPGHEGVLPSIKNEAGVEVWRVPVLKAGNRQPARRIIGFASFMVSGAVATLFGARPDVIVVSLPSILIWPAVLLLAKLRRIPTVLLLRDVEPAISLQLRGLDGGRLARLAIAIWSRLYALADSVVLVHESQRTSLPPALFANIPVAAIDHGVDIERMAATTADAPPFLLGRRHPDDLVVLYTGTFGVAQDLAAFAEALGNLSEPPPISFHFVGDGEQIEHLLELQRIHSLDRLFIHPPVSREAVASLLRQADVLLMSYKKDTRHIPGMIGSKFYEYCASGKPILVFSYGIGSERVTEIGNGWRCDAGTAQELGQRLREIVASTGRSVLGARGSAYAQLHFDKKQRHQQWIRLVDAALRQHGNRGFY